MARAHLYKPIQDGAGNLRPGAVVRVLEPGSLDEVPVPLYVADSGPNTIPNPFTSDDGLIDFYLDQPRRVRIGVRSGGGDEQFFENIDVLLPFDEGAPVHGHPYAPVSHSHDFAGEVHNHLAENVGYVPGGSLASTDVQDALTELDAEKAPLVHVHNAADVPFAPAGTLAAATVQGALQELDGDVQGLDGRIDTLEAEPDPTASNIPFTPAGTLAATNVQAALAEVDGDVQAHLTDTVDAHDASAVSFAPAGGLAATDVQAALVELDTEKAATGHTHAATPSSLNTVGAGLAPLAGRKSGDHHYDTSIGRDFVYSGSIGLLLADSFDVDKTYASSHVAPGYPAQPYQIVNPAPSAVGGALVANGGLFTQVANTDTLETTTQAKIAALPEAGKFIALYAASTINVLWYNNIRVHVNSAGTLTLDSVYGNNGYGGLVAPVVSTTVVGVGDVIALAYDNLTDKATVLVNGVVAATVTFSSWNPYDSDPGSRYWGVGGDSTSGKWDDLKIIQPGTAKWSSGEPVYFQAQLATGNVAVANHVLKPGLRVPTACALYEVVLRIETAPVGSSLTVTVERFNGGVSQGVIATVSIPTGENVGSVSGLNALCAKGDILKFNVTAVGSTTAGADLTASLELR